jgi:hypothetical protein
MVTVFQAVSEYCSLTNHPAASHKDYRNCGQIISTHFRRFWGLSRLDAVAEVRYVIEDTPFRKIVVVAYPDSFKDEMVRLIDTYFAEKADRIQKDNEQRAAKIAAKEAQKNTAPPEKKQRTRKPVQKPAFSLKQKSP